MPEKITKEGDWLHCLCGNRPDMGGFAVSTAAGRICADDAEPGDDAAPDWDGIHYLCLNCGRIINQNTLDVTGIQPQHEPALTPVASIDDAVQRGNAWNRGPRSPHSFEEPGEVYCRRCGAGPTGFYHLGQ